MCNKIRLTDVWAIPYIIHVLRSLATVWCLFIVYKNGLTPLCISHHNKHIHSGLKVILPIMAASAEEHFGNECGRWHAEGRAHPRPQTFCIVACM